MLKEENRLKIRDEECVKFLEDLNIKNIMFCRLVSHIGTTLSITCSPYTLHNSDEIYLPRRCDRISKELIFALTFGDN